VDSGSKALELLGLVRERNGSIHSPYSPENHHHQHQVKDFQFGCLFVVLLGIVLICFALIAGD